MMRIALKAMVLAAILMLVMPLTAQVEHAEMGSDALAELLRFVPDNDEARRFITYSDYRAAETARGLTVIPTDYVFFNTMPDIPRRLWLAAVPKGGIDLDFFAAFDVMPGAMGIDFFQIDRSLVWGVPPDRGFVLQGDFSEVAIRVAHDARGFVESELDGAPLWCSADGCDTGLVPNLTDRQIADLFGGDLGRKFPRALTETFFLSAGRDTSLEQMTEAGINGNDSLADDPAYQAAVAALDDDHYLRAALFALPSDFLDFDYSRIAPDTSEEQLRELVDRLRGGPEELPVYNLVVFADVADDQNEYAVIALVYRDEEQATMAGEILTSRINAAESATVRQPWIDLITDREGTLEAATVFHEEEADRYVTLIRVSKPLPPNSADENGRYVQSGLLFRLFLDGYMRRDLGWLQPVLLR